MGTCETKLAEMREDNVESYGGLSGSVTSNNSEDPVPSQIDEKKNAAQPTHNIPPVEEYAVRPSHQITENQPEEVVEAPKKSGRNSNFPHIKAGRPSNVKSSSPEEKRSKNTQVKAVSDFRTKLPDNMRKNGDKSTTPEKDRQKKVNSQEDKSKKNANNFNIVYSNEGLQEIANIIHPELLSLNDPDAVLLEGPLLKYRPGTTFFWVERWCVITKSEFKYYKAQWHAACPDMKPLLSVPITDIQVVFRVMLDLPKIQQKKNFLTSDQKKYEELYQFEIFNNLTDYPYAHEILNRDNIDGDENEQLRPEFNIDKMENFILWKKHDDEKRSKVNSPNKIRKAKLQYYFLYC